MLDAMNKVDRVLQEIENFTAAEIRELLKKMAERIELLGWLKVADTAFSEWDNEEDAVYDQL
ncbi:hypothetical protein Psch_03518 [Pelotomaculum schinkii]|uniref:Uncharacterized protein n=1 Tax=Pelotomaculum schinkii TaxID=78350 RepID=A0A4Y7R7L6_9FIRM|nr:hypothetical protein [Pelotomaculum schinkii]TEB04756.1 hypothetical protein Psch_03518 [Pelotomaculum schinkii]